MEQSKIIDTLETYQAAAAERVVGVPRTPNRDAMCTTIRRGLRGRRGVDSQLELSPNDGGVAGRL